MPLVECPQDLAVGSGPFLGNIPAALTDLLKREISSRAGLGLAALDTAGVAIFLGTYETNAEARGETCLTVDGERGGGEIIRVARPPMHTGKRK